MTYRSAQPITTALAWGYFNKGQVIPIAQKMNPALSFTFRAKKKLKGRNSNVYFHSTVASIRVLSNMEAMQCQNSSAP